MGTKVKAGVGGAIQLPDPAAGFFADGEDIEVRVYAHHIGLWKPFRPTSIANTPSSKATHKNAFKEAAQRFDSVLDALNVKSEPECKVALYLGGYIVECRLKWAICEEWGVTQLSDAEYRFAQQDGHEYSLTGGRGHDLELLLRCANHQGLLGDRALHRAWGLCLQWSTAWRYSTPRDVLGRSVEYLTAYRAIDGWLKGAR